ncbi:hypothetical protein Tco_1185872 [Tanacetum coccineum]
MSKVWYDNSILLSWDIRNVPIIRNMWQRLLSISGFSLGKKSVTMMHRLPTQLRGQNRKQPRSQPQLNKPNRKTKFNAKPLKSTLFQPPNQTAPAKPQEEETTQGFWPRWKLIWLTFKAGRVSKKRTLQLRDEFIDEGVPATEPRVDDEEAIVQMIGKNVMRMAYCYIRDHSSCSDQGTSH